MRRESDMIMNVALLFSLPLGYCAAQDCPLRPEPGALDPLYVPPTIEKVSR